MKKSEITTITFCLSFFVWALFIVNDDATSMGSSKIEIKLEHQFEGVAKVTDGDTIKINDKKVRLLYIDAPESSQTCMDADYNQYQCGIVAKEFLQKLTAEKIVKCFYEKFDKYGRYLAECFINDKSINNDLVKNGMAVTYFFDHINQEIAASEMQAKQNKIGIWQGAFEMPKDYRRRNSFKHKVNKS